MYKDRTIADVLVFFTGFNSVPQTGFSDQPTVTFLHENYHRFCTSSTCDLTLRLPTAHGDDYGS